MVFAQIVMAGAAIYGAYESRKAGKEAEKQARARAAIERRQRVRQRRLEQAKVQSAAAQRGAQGSSGETSAISGLSSQFLFNEGQSAIFQQRASNIAGIQQNIANANTVAQVAGLYGQAVQQFSPFNG
jgi:hypothetical protein